MHFKNVCQFLSIVNAPKGSFAFNFMSFSVQKFTRGAHPCSKYKINNAKRKIDMIFIPKTILARQICKQSVKITIFAGCLVFDMVINIRYRAR